MARLVGLEGDLRHVVVIGPSSEALGALGRATMDVVPAKDDEARAWYECFDFEPSPTDPFHLFLLLKGLRAALAG